MFLYRITNRKNAADLSGLGASFYGGRWNNPGNSVIYTADTIALATLEQLVHKVDYIPNRDFVLTTIEIPGHVKTDILSENHLPDGWRSYPPPKALQILGDQWISDKASLALKVPSAIIDYEFNFLINPAHPDFKYLKIVSITDFSFDPKVKTKERKEELPSFNIDQKEIVRERIINENETLLASTKPVNFSFDIFISHASEDKETLVNPIVEQMKIYGLKYWYDIEQIRLGDRITRKINHGLKNSRFIFAVLTTTFIKKPWAMQEIESALNKETDSGSTFVFPMLAGTYNERQEILDHINLLRDKLHIVWNNNPEEIVKKIIQAIAVQ